VLIACLGGLPASGRGIRCSRRSRAQFKSTRFSRGDESGITCGANVKVVSAELLTWLWHSEHRARNRIRCVRNTLSESAITVQRVLASTWPVVAGHLRERVHCIVNRWLRRDDAGCHMSCKCFCMTT